MYLKRNLSLIIIFIIVFAASATALQIEPVEILNAKYEPINYLSFNNPVLVNLVFNYTLTEGESFTGILVNAVDVYPDGIYSGSDYSNLAPICEGDEGSYSCVLSALTLKAKNTSFNITVKGTLSGSNGTQAIAESTLILMNADNSKPTVSFLGTDNCYEGVCYIASDRRTELKMTIEDERASFTKAAVGFKVGTKTEYATKCTDMTCEGSTRIKCQDNQKLILSVWHKGSISRDDLGNKINGTPANLTCDATPPLLKEHTISSELGTNTLVIGKGIIFEFNATDVASPVLNITVNADSVGAGNVSALCTKPSVTGSSFICRAIVTPDIDQPGLYEFNVKVEDVAGWEAKESLNLNILKTTNETINLWKVAGVEQSSNSFSRPNMEFERVLFTKVSFQPSGTAEIVKIMPDNACYAAEPNVTGINTDVVSVKMIAKQNNEIFLKIAIRENNDHRYDKLQKLEFNCPVSISSKKGNYYYSTPEKDNFTITITLKDEANVQQRLDQEINATLKSIESQINAANKIGTAVDYAEGLCAVCEGISIVGGITGSLEAVLNAWPATMSAGKAMGGVSDTMQGVRYGQICGPTATTLCEFITCKSDMQNFATDWMDEVGGGKALSYLGYANASSSMNPYKSYITAAATLCLPAIQYHYNNYLGIQCQYLNCISNDYIKYGQDISTCQQDKAYSECMYFWGGALDGIPFVSMIRDVTGRIGAMMKDPVKLFGFAVPLACKQVKAQGTVHGLCVTVQEAFTTTKDVKRLADIVDQLSKIPDAGKIADCSDVIANAKNAYTKPTPLGYNKDQYEPPVKTEEVEFNDGGGTVTCVGNECTYKDKGSSTGYKIRVIQQGPGQEPLYYYYDGNKKVDFDDAIIEASGNGDKPVDKPVSEEEKKDSVKEATEKAKAAETEYTNALANVKKIEGELASDYAENHEAREAKRAELEDAKKELGAAKTNLDEKTAEVKIEENKQNSEISKNAEAEKAKAAEIAALKVEIEREAKELSKASVDELAKKLGIEPEIAAIYKAQWEYATVLDKMDEMENDRRTLENLKKLERLQEKDESKLSKDELTEKNNLQNSVYSSAYSDYTAAQANVKKLEDELNYKYAESYPEEREAATVRLNEAKEKLKAAKTNLDKKKDEVHSDEYKQKLKDDADKTKEEIHDKKVNLRKSYTEQKFTQYFGSWESTMMSAWGNVQAVDGLRSFLNMNWGMVNEDSNMAKWGDYLIEDVSQFEKAWCKANIQPSERLGDAVLLNTVVSGTDIFQTGAQVGGRKAGPTFDGTKNYYEYWVQGSVVTSSTKNDGLVVKVIFVEANGAETDLTDRFEGNGPLPAGGQFAFGRGKIYSFIDEKNYDKICLKFDGAGSLSAYFDHVDSDSWNSDRICQKLILE